MIKQLLAVTAIVGMMAGTALAQSSGGGSGSGGAGSGSSSSSSGSSGSGSNSSTGGAGSQNLNHNPPTAGGIAPGSDQTPMYRDSQGRPCTAGSAGCSRVEGAMKK